MFKLYLAFCVILNINYFFVWFKKIYNLSLVAHSWINHVSATVYCHHFLVSICNFHMYAYALFTPTRKQFLTCNFAVVTRASPRPPSRSRPIQLAFSPLPPHASNCSLFQPIKLPPLRPI
jgi:hypothetical protein